MVGKGGMGSRRDGKVKSHNQAKRNQEGRRKSEGGERGRKRSRMEGGKERHKEGQRG